MNRIIYRVLANFMIGFFGPLTGSSVAQQIYQNTISFEQSLVVGLLGSLLTTGLSIGYELRKIGERKR